MNDELPTRDRRDSERTRYAGYRPRRPVEAASEPDRSGRTAMSADPDSGPGSRRAARRRTIGVGLATIAATSTFVVGIMLGWMARGGPPKAELVVTTQPVPAVTVTREVAP